MITLTLHPHLSSLLMGLALLAILGWLWFLQRRYATHYPPRTTWLLVAPKIIVALLFFLALFDPSWRASRPRSQNDKMLVLVDASSSMDVKDSDQGTRAQRAEALAQTIDQRLRSLVKIEKQSFDMDLPASQTGQEIRGTDLGKVLADLSGRPDVSAYRAIVLLTDGGDEPVQTANLPGVPLFIAGIGTDPSTWNDVALIDVDAPTSVEEKTSFDVSADVKAYRKDPQFAQAVQALPVTLKEYIDGQWQTIGEEKVDVSVNQARVKFHVESPEESRKVVAGASRKFQLSVASTPGELSTLNNERTFSVDVRKRSFRVLLFGRKLDWDFAHLRWELLKDPAIKITSMYRTSEENVRLEQGPQESDEGLKAGFPSDVKVLKQFKCVILGSFPAADLSVGQQQALVKYVEDGGSAVFLGGPDSFGRGGYDQTPLAPLLPWHTSRAEGEMLVGKFPVRVPQEAAGHTAVAGLARSLQMVRSPFIFSVNPVGKAHAGTLSLLDASVGENVVPLIALQRYGNGQTLGIATNTLWRWDRMTDKGGSQGDLHEAYHQFWHSTVGYLSGMYEGNRFLLVTWDRPSYRPSEAAEATMQVAGQSVRGQLRFTGTVKHGSEKPAKIAIEPVAGKDQVFKTKIFFSDRGEYLVHIDALAGFDKVDTYERTLRVSPTRNEGARLEVDHAFLNDLAGRGGGMYAPEAESEKLLERLRASLVTGPIETQVRLVQENGIFFFMALAVLIAEWVVRRRLNLF